MCCSKRIKTFSRKRKQPHLGRLAIIFERQLVFEAADTAAAEALVETQSTALFGDVKQLTRQMQEAVGKDVNSLEEVMQRVQQATCRYHR